MIEWRVYYSDGSTFDSSQGGPADAPPWGVQVVVQRCPSEGRNLQVETDYYWWDPGLGRWFGGDFLGVVDALARNCGPVRFGRRIPGVEFDGVRTRAMADPDFPASATWRAEGGSSANP
jgi:hypothetical protein